MNRMIGCLLEGVKQDRSGPFSMHKGNDDLQNPPTSAATSHPRHANVLWMNTLFDGMQVTVIFLVDVDKCLPDQKQWPEVWAQQQAWKQAKKDHEDSLVSRLTCLA